MAVYDFEAEGRKAAGMETPGLAPASPPPPKVYDFEAEAEPEFQRWYQGHAATLGLNSDPDDPQHFYDYRRAFAAGAGPDPAGHWPSQFKLAGHPNRYVGGIDTITGAPQPSVTPAGYPTQEAVTQLAQGFAPVLPAAGRYLFGAEAPLAAEPTPLEEGTLAGAGRNLALSAASLPAYVARPLLRLPAAAAAQAASGIAAPVEVLARLAGQPEIAELAARFGAAAGATAQEQVQNLGADLVGMAQAFVDVPVAAGKYLLSVLSGPFSNRLRQVGIEPETFQRMAYEDPIGTGAVLYGAAKGGARVAGDVGALTRGETPTLAPLATLQEGARQLLPKPKPEVAPPAAEAAPAVPGRRKRLREIVGERREIPRGPEQQAEFWSRLRQEVLDRLETEEFDPARAEELLQASETAVRASVRAQRERLKIPESERLSTAGDEATVAEAGLGVSHEEFLRRVPLDVYLRVVRREARSSGVSWDPAMEQATSRRWQEAQKPAEPAPPPAAAEVPEAVPEPAAPIKTVTVRPRRRVEQPTVGELTPDDLSDPGIIARWVAQQGGLWDEAHAGEVRLANENHGAKGGGVIGLVRKGGLSFDDLSERLAETGLMDRERAFEFLRDEWAPGALEPPRFEGPGRIIARRAGEQAERFGVERQDVRVERAARGHLTHEYELNPEPGRRRNVARGDVFFLPEREDVFRVKRDPREPGRLLLKDGGPPIRLLPGERFEGIRLGKVPKEERAAIRERLTPQPEEAPSLADVRQGVERGRAARERTEAEEAARAGEVARGQANLFDEESQRRTAEAAAEREAEGAEAAKQPELLPPTPPVEDRAWVVVDAETRKPLSEPGTQAEALASVQTLREQGKNVTVVRLKPRAKPKAGLAGMPEGPLRAAAARPMPQRTPATPSSRLTAAYSAPEAVVRRSNIIRDMQSIAYAPIRFGRMLGRRYAGYLRVHERVIRMKGPQDVTTAAHELGHALQRLLFPEEERRRFEVPKSIPDAVAMNAELKAMGVALYGKERPAGGYISEGLAEFVRLYIEDRADARKQAPKFFSEFAERLMFDDASQAAGRMLDRIAVSWRRWRDQPSVAKVFSTISVSESPRRPMTLQRLYAGLMDYMDPIKRVQMGLTGELRHGAGSPWTSAIAFRGWVGSAELALHHGIPDLRPNELVGFLRRRGWETEALAGKGFFDVPTRQKNPNVADLAFHKILRAYRERGLAEVHAKQWRLTAAGVAEAKRAGFGKIGEPLGEILKGVADVPLPFDASIPQHMMTAAQRVGSMIPAVRLLRTAQDRGLDSFRVYATARRAIALFEEFERRAGKQILKGIHPSKVENPVVRIREATGIDIKDWRQALRDVETPQTKDAFSRLVSWREKVLHMLVDEGFMTEDDFSAITRVRDYVPFRRVLSEQQPRGPMAGPKFGNVPTPVRRFKGRTAYDIIDPIESLVADTFAIVNAVKRNQVVRQLVEMGEEYPGGGWVIESIPKRALPTKLALEEVKKEVDEVVRRAGGDPLMLDPVDYAIAATVWRSEKTAPAGENAVAVFRRGKREFYKLDPELYRAVAGLDHSAANLVINLMGAPARWRRAGATLTPEFMLRNLMRDALSAAIFHEGGVNPFGGFVPGLDTAKGLKSRLAADDWFFRYYASGAGYAAMVSLDRKYMQQNLHKVLTSERLHERAGNVLRHPIEAAQVLSSISEEATRIGNFRATVDRLGGMDHENLLRGMVEARDGSIDFGRVGSILRDWRQTVAFLNASIQGLDKFGRVIAGSARDVGVSAKALGRGELRPPVRAMGLAARLATYVIAPSLLSWALMKKAHGGRKDVEDWQKDLFWLLPLGGTIYKIPKPHEVGVIFGSGVERMLDWIDEHEPEALEGYPESLIQVLVPTVIPTLMEPAIDVGMNRDFTGRPIEPERERRLLPEARVGPYTSEAAKVLAGVSRAVPGLSAAQLSPRQVDALIEGWTGGVGKQYVAPASDVAIRGALAGTKTGDRLRIGEGRKLPRRLSDQPIARAFVVRPESAKAGRVEAFYDRMEQAEQAYQTWRQAKSEVADSMLEDPETARLVRIYHALAETRQRLSVENSEARKATDAGDRKALDAARERILDLVRRGEKEAEAADEHPDAGRLLRMDRKAVELRTESEGRRNAVITRIETMIEDGEGDALYREIQKMPPEDRRWALDYARHYRMRLREGRVRTKLRSVPKAQRREVREAGAP